MGDSNASTVGDAISFVCQKENLNTELSQFAGQTLELNVGLQGGKVHGSLSRAGKVKGQTPKVEKQDKKKAKTGRAKRRFQYNRRFVNVVQGFGKKRGPNSNQS